MRHAEKKTIGFSAALMTTSNVLVLLLLAPAQAQTSQISPAGPALSATAKTVSLITEGDRLLRAGDVRAAAESYLSATKSAPKQPLYQIMAGVALASAGRTSEALAAFRRANDLSKGTDLLTALLVQGALSETADDNADSESLFGRTVQRFSRPGRGGLDTSASTARLLTAVKQYPQSPILWLLLGDTYQLAEEWSKAGASYRTAIRLSSRWVKPRINLGLCQLAQGRSSQAVAAFHGALTLDPANAQAQIAKADAQLQAGSVDAAVLSYRKVENSSNNRVAAQAATGIGQAYAQRGQVPEAVASLNRARTLAPSDPTPAVALGAVQSQAGNFPAAAREYSDALRLSGSGLFESKGVLYRALAETQLSARDSNGAITTINRALAEEPSSQPLWYRLWAQALFLRGDAPGGEAKLKQSLESETTRYPLDTLNALNARHLIAKLATEHDTALAAAKDDAVRTRLLRPLANLARFQGIVTDEVRYRERLVELEPTGPDWFALAEARERAGDTVGARSAYQSAAKRGGLTPAAARQAKERAAR